MRTKAESHLDSLRQRCLGDPHPMVDHTTVHCRSPSSFTTSNVLVIVSRSFRHVQGPGGMGGSRQLQRKQLLHKTHPKVQDLIDGGGPSRDARELRFYCSAVAGEDDKLPQHTRRKKPVPGSILLFQLSPVSFELVNRHPPTPLAVAALLWEGRGRVSTTPTALASFFGVYAEPASMEY
jgi:hypothetical protein